MRALAMSPESGAFLVLLFAQAAAGAALIETPLWEKADLRAFTIIGCVIGSFLAVAIFPPLNSPNLVRDLGLKFFTSLFLGVLFTPLIVRYWDLPRDVDVVMAIGGGWSLIASSAVHKIAPIIERLMVARAKAAADLAEQAK